VSRNAYERHTGWPRAAFELAYSLIEARRLEEARELVTADEALRSPAWVRPYFEGWIVLAEGRASEAVRPLGVAAALASSEGFYPFPSIPLARALMDLGRLDHAEAELRRALASPIYHPVEAHHARELLRATFELRAAQ
jgi:hypothetical protein